MANLLMKCVSTDWIFRTKHTLQIFDDGNIVYDRAPKLFFKEVHTEIHASKVHFFTNQKSGVWGLLGLMFGLRNIYFGDKEQIEFNHIKVKELDELKAFLVKFEAPFTKMGEGYKCWNLLNPFSWFRKEYLFANDEGIAYQRGNKEMSFIPYGELKYFYDHTTLFTFGWDVAIIGEQYILPKARVHGKFVSIVKSHLPNDVQDDKAFKLTPGFFYYLFHPWKIFASRKPIVFITDKYVVSIDKSVIIIPVGDVIDCEIEREHWYSWRGRVVIEGELDSMRRDQLDLVCTIKKENIGRFKWRKVKNLLK